MSVNENDKMNSIIKKITMKGKDECFIILIFYGAENIFILIFKKYILN